MLIIQIKSILLLVKLNELIRFQLKFYNWLRNILLVGDYVLKVNYNYDITIQAIQCIILKEKFNIFRYIYILNLIMFIHRIIMVQRNFASNHISYSIIGRFKILYLQHFLNNLILMVDLRFNQ